MFQINNSNEGSLYYIYQENKFKIALIFLMIVRFIHLLYLENN